MSRTIRVQIRSSAFDTEISDIPESASVKFKDGVLTISEGGSTLAVIREVLGFYDSQLTVTRTKPEPKKDWVDSSYSDISTAYNPKGIVTGGYMP